MLEIIMAKTSHGCWIKSGMRFAFVIWHAARRRYTSIGLEISNSWAIRSPADDV
jgi:hypothetical protein